MRTDCSVLSVLFCLVLFSLMTPEVAAQQTARVVDQKSGLFWDISYSGTGTLEWGNYVLGEAWLTIPDLQSASVTQVGCYFPGTTTVDPSYTGPSNPQPGAYRNGTMKNPRGGGTLAVVGGSSLLARRPTGYDNRAPDGSYTSLFNSSEFTTFPLTMSPGDTIVSTVSQDEGATGGCSGSRPWEISAFPGECTSSPTRLAAVLTCNHIKPDDDEFRKPYSMPSPGARKVLPKLRTLYIDWSVLPRVAIPVNTQNPAPTPGYLAGFLNRVWLEHTSGESHTGLIFPTGHMHGYGAWQRRGISAAALLAMTNPDPSLPNGPRPGEPLNADFREMIFGMLQIGIDTFGLMQDDTHSFEGGGAHVGGRKFLVAFAGKMFGSHAYTTPAFPVGMTGPWTVTRWVNSVQINDYPRFKEDQQFFSANPIAGPLARGDWDWMGSPWKWGESYTDRGWQEIHPSAWGPVEKNSESYRIGGVTPPFVGSALALRMLGLEDVWANLAFFGGVDRYMIQEHPAVYPLYWNTIGVLPTNVQRNPNSNPPGQPIYGTGRYHRLPQDQNNNNIYSTYPTFSADMWNAYRWNNNQGTITIKPDGSTFESMSDAGPMQLCPQVRNPVLLTQMRAHVGATLLVELYSNESMWVPVTIMVAGLYYPAGLSLHAYFPNAYNDAVTYVSLPSAVSFVGLLNNYGYFAQVMEMPNDPQLVGTTFAAQAGVFDSAITCLGTSNAVLMTVEQ